MNNQEKNYISKKEVARICETSESSIVQWVHSTDFPKPFQLGSRTVFIRKEVLSWLEKQISMRGFAKPKKTIWSLRCHQNSRIINFWQLNY